MNVSASGIASRIAASLVGGYAFTWGFTVLGIALLVSIGVSYHEAQTLLYMLAFLVFLAVFCWAYAAARASTVWCVLAGGGSVMTLMAWLLTRSMG